MKHKRKNEKVSRKKSHRNQFSLKREKFIFSGEKKRKAIKEINGNVEKFRHKYFGRGKFHRLLKHVKALVKVSEVIAHTQRRSSPQKNMQLKL
jgi:hypothetical protein